MTGRFGEKHGGDTGGGIPPGIFPYLLLGGSEGGQRSSRECCRMDTSGCRSRMDSGQPHGFQFGPFRRRESHCSRTAHESLLVHLHKTIQKKPSMPPTWQFYTERDFKRPDVADLAEGRVSPNQCGWQSSKCSLESTCRRHCWTSFPIRLMNVN